MSKAFLALTLILLSACVAPRPTVKIALVAPFEGRLRRVGYDAFPAVRLAIREQIAVGGIGGAHVTFIAYNDEGDPQAAARIAHNVARDPEVVAVIGHLVPSTTLAALGVYTRAGLPVLVPSVPAHLVPRDPLVFRMGPGEAAPRREVKDATCAALDATWTAAGSPFGECIADAPPVSELPAAQHALASFTALSLGPAPGLRAIVAYDATAVLLAALRADAQAHGIPTRTGLAEALRRVNHDGLLGRIAFDQDNAWADAPLWVYAR